MASNIDWACPPKMLDKELMQIAPHGALGRRTVDKLVEVKLFSSAVACLLMHLETQSQRDASFAERMFVYFCRIRDKYNQKIVSFALLGDGDINWRPDGFGESNFGCQFSFQFPIVELIDYAVTIEKFEKATNPFAFVIAAQLTTLQTVNAPENRCQWKLRLLRPLCERGMSPEGVRKLFRVFERMMQLPKDLQIQFRGPARKIRTGREDALYYID
ncbi:hypothetical protein SH139x_004040 [Planctomycetaceae bacterium SH139]